MHAEQPTAGAPLLPPSPLPASLAATATTARTNVVVTESVVTGGTQYGTVNGPPTTTTTAAALNETTNDTTNNIVNDNLRPSDSSGEYNTAKPVITGLALGTEETGLYAEASDELPGPVTQETPPPLCIAWLELWWAAHRGLLMQSWHGFIWRVRHMSLRQIIWVIFLIALVSGSNVLQVLTLNFWLRSFPADGVPGNYTAFALPGILYAIVFVICLAIYVAVRRPDMRFATHAHGWLILIGVGFCDTFTSWLSTYAATHTSEVLQALFMNLCPLYAVVMCKYLLHDPRTYCNVWIVTVFVLTIGGILAASLYGLITAPAMNDNRVWVFIFFCSVPFRVLMNVWQSLYMIVYTHDPSFVDWLRARWAKEDEEAEELRGRTGGVAVSHVTAEPAASEAHETPSATLPAAREAEGSSNAHNDGNNDESCGGSEPRSEAGHTATESAATLSTRFYQGEDTVVKLVMLVGDTVWQSVFTLALLPADALPWWGNSATVAETWTNFGEGIYAVFTIGDNFLYGSLYTLSFVMNYVAAAYLNHYSAALCSIVSQLSSPLTALLLIAVPSWNVQSGGDAPWYCNLIAVVLLSIAAVVYVIWEEATDAIKVEGERELKRQQLHVQRPKAEEDDM